MGVEERITNGLLWAVYGDALGFLKENTDITVEKLNDFTYYYDKDLMVKKPKGQYSYVTELMLITIKSFLDSAKNFKNAIDYPRYFEELKLWIHYRHGNPSNVLEKLGNKNFYRDKFYWDDVRGQGISRILPIAMVNKNYHGAEKETYKNLIYLNRHPRIILTGLILLRTVHLVLERDVSEKEELIQGLKEYLIHLQLNQLNHGITGDLTGKYKIQFEKEKIDYLMTLDLLVNDKEIIMSNWDCKGVLVYVLDIFFKLEQREEIFLNNIPNEDIKEVLAIAYGLWGLMNREDFGIKNLLKEEEFIRDMGKYLFKLRNFQINRTPYEKKEDTINLFHLQKSNIIKHNILGVTKVNDRIETLWHIQLLLETRSGIYTFVKAKGRQ